jgi:endoglucanase
MYWQVDGGGLNHMSTNYTDGPHKETLVNVGSWTWRGSGPYKVNFVAKMNGAVVAQKLISISTGNSQPVPATVVTTQPASVPTQAVSAPSTSGLYVNPLSPTLAQAREWQSSRPTDAALMLKIGNEPSARWFGGWNSNIYQDVKSYVDTAASANATPVLVAYNIPQRDCGGYSAGGSGSADSYKAWIGNMANGIGNRNAIVVLEPDATALTDCLSGTDLETRYQLLNFAVNTLEAKPGVKVYIDAGHPGWINSSEMANRLRQAGVSNAAGFSLNVSNFYTTPQNASYGQEVSRLINNKHFVIDTARNGLGGNGEWCNPSGRALGNKPTLNTGNSVIDGFLWIKTPGESDGNCNGGPGAGQWWGDYALGLAERASW